MSLVKQFNLEAAEKPKAIQPFAQRRQKFIAAVEKQLAGVPDDGTSTITSTWVWKSDDGDWFISPRYGRTPLELSPGLNAIKCADVADVAKNLQKLKALADEGKLDDVLMEAATTIRNHAVCGLKELLHHCPLGFQPEARPSLPFRRNPIIGNILDHFLSSVQSKPWFVVEGVLFSKVAGQRRRGT